MSTDNNKFTITDEQMEWDEVGSLDPLESPAETPEEDGDGEAAVRTTERRWTLLIAGGSAVAGGLVVALLGTIVTPSSSSGSTSPQGATYLQPVRETSTATIVAPAPSPRHVAPVVTHKSTTPYDERHTRLPPRRKAKHTNGKSSVKHRHRRKEPRMHTQRATKHIRYRSRRNAPKPIHHRHHSHQAK